MGLGVQPYNYTFSLWPSNCKPSILTFKVWDRWGSGSTPWPSGRSGPTRHLSRAAGLELSALRQDYKEKSRFHPLGSPALPFLGHGGRWGPAWSSGLGYNASMHSEAPSCSRCSETQGVLEGAHLPCRGFGGRGGVKRAVLPVETLC